MKHFVFWAPEADERLQALILSDDASGFVVRAVREIDFWLARGPLDFGESRYGAGRIRSSDCRTLRRAHRPTDGDRSRYLADRWNMTTDCA